MALSLIYLAAECLGFILGLITLASSWQYRHRDPPPPLPSRSVDVFVPAYREPIEVIRRTLRAAVALRYPHQTWLLDDGDRPELRALASALGVRYSARKENRNAKAGNLNHALAQSTADFVVVFDADHVAMPHALDVLLGFFKDESVAMVQTPQDYFNTNAFQYMNPARKPGLWHDQSFFYNIAQPCRDSYNAGSCVGTGVAYRRAALESIGGIPVDTLTEDIHTSIKLHKGGWRTVYLNEPVAYGIAAADLADYYRTRYRWAHGNLTALRHERILSCPGLTLRQRLSYLAFGLIYLEGWQQFLLFSIPPCALFLGLAPFEITVFNVLLVLAFPLVAALMLQETGCGFSRYWTDEIFAMARWPVHLAASLALAGGRSAWKSSSKNIRGRVSVGLVIPQAAVFALNVVALAYATHRLIGEFQVGPLGNWLIGLFSPGAEHAAIDIFAPMPRGYSLELVAIAGFWALYNALRAGFLIWKAISNASESHEYFRFQVSLPVLLPALGANYGITESLAEDWVRVRLPAGARVAGRGEEVTLRLLLPSGEISAMLRVTRAENGCLEGKLSLTDEAARDRLSDCLHSVPWHRDLQLRDAYFLTPSDVVLKAIGIRGSGIRARKDWKAVLLYREGDAAPSPALLSVSSDPDAETTLVCFCRLDPERPCAVELLATQEGGRVQLHVIAEETISGLSRGCLDGTNFRRYRMQAGVRHRQRFVRYANATVAARVAGNHG